MKRRHIFNCINCNERRSDPSWGCDDHFTQDIRVGWGSADSHTLAELSVYRRPRGERTFYQLLIDGELYCEAYHKHGELTFVRERFKDTELYVPFFTEDLS